MSVPPRTKPAYPISSTYPPVNTNTVLRDPNHPIPTFLNKNKPPHEKPELCHSKGVWRGKRGPYTATPDLDWKSLTYAGPGYYVPSERKWLKHTEKRDLPPLWKPDIIPMEDEETWVNFQRERDRPRWELGLFDQPYHIKRGVPVHTLQARYPDSVNRKWDHAGSFSRLSNKWMREHEYETGLPDDSIFFYNEEDWLKYKYYGTEPWLNTDDE